MVVNWAHDQDMPLAGVTAAKTVLMQARDEDWPAAKAVAFLRDEFGGHPSADGIAAAENRRPPGNT